MPPKPPIPPAGGAPNASTDYWSDYFNSPSMSGFRTGGRGGVESQQRQASAPVQMPTFQTGNQDQARQRQQQVIQDLQRAAMGDPNSRAQQGLTEAYGAAGSQQSSLGSTMRGQSAGAAQRGIQAGQQGIQRGYAGDQQMLQLQEQQAAQQMLAQLLSQQQGQDIGQAQVMAQGINQGNAMDEAMRQFYAGQGSSLNMEQGQIGAERAAAQRGFDLEGANTTSRLLRKGTGALATALSTGASMGPKSDQQYIDDAFNGAG